MRWIVEFDSHKEKKGDIFEGDELPLYLVGKVKKLATNGDREFEVNTPQKESQPRQPK